MYKYKPRLKTMYKIKKEITEAGVNPIIASFLTALVFVLSMILLVVVYILVLPVVLILTFVGCFISLILFLYYDVKECFFK